MFLHLLFKLLLEHVVVKHLLLCHCLDFRHLHLGLDDLLNVLCALFLVVFLHLLLRERQSLHLVLQFTHLLLQHVDLAFLFVQLLILRIVHLGLGLVQNS